MFAVKCRRETLERSQLDVAAAIGASQSAVCAWENGVRGLTLDRFLALVDELGGEVAVTFGGGRG